MESPQDEEFGFKRLTLENWLTIDPAWSGVVMSASKARPEEAWIHDLLLQNLNGAVPVEIRKLYEVARGVLVYALVFYPLLALGVEQMCRAAEAATKAKCVAMKAPYRQTKTFEDRIDWLGEHGSISAENISRWHAVRHLRNGSSHPTDQSIFNLAMALGLMDDLIELVDALFQDVASSSHG